MLEYTDINVSIGPGIGVTFGEFITPAGDYGYIGFGFLTPGVSVSYSPNDISPGKWSWQIQRSYWINTAVGADFDGHTFGEVGGGIPGVSATVYYTAPKGVKSNYSTKVYKYPKAYSNFSPCKYKVPQFFLRP